MKYFKILTMLLATALLSGPALAQDQEGTQPDAPAEEAMPAEDGETSIVVELNKAEQVGRGCQYFLLLRNGTDLDIRTFRLDMYFFDADGVIAKRLLVDAPTLSPGGTRVANFLAPDLQCANVTEILVNDVQPCETADGETPDCYGMLTLRSRTDAGFE